MSLFAKVLGLLLVAWATSARKPFDHLAVNELLEAALVPFNREVRYARSVAELATHRLLLQIGLNSPYEPKCSDDNGKMRCGILNAQELDLFKKFVKTERSTVVDCSKNFLKNATKQRDTVNLMVSQYREDIDAEKLDTLGSLFDKWAAKRMGFNEKKEVERGIRLMLARSRKLVNVVKTRFNEEVEYAHQTADAWAKHIVRCVSEAKNDSDSTLMTE